MAGGTKYNRGKFKELVLYLSQASADDEGFGVVKLNKLLYRADFEAYRLLGHSITGATYEKQEYGPVVRDLPIILDELAASGYVIWQRIPAGPHMRKVPSTREQPDLRQLPNEEIRIVDAALEELRWRGGKSVSEWSHETSAGWQVQEIGQEIPYSSALINLKPLSEPVLARVRDRLAARYG